KATSFYPLEKFKNELGEIISKSIYYPNRPDWSLEKIAQVKSYILLTGLSQNPDNFFWQEESRGLVKEKREKEALTLGKKILDEAGEEVATKLFIVRYFVELCKEKSSIKTLQIWLENVEISKASPEDKADYYHLQLLCLQKLRDKQNFKKVYKVAKEHFQKHNIDTQNIDALKL
ncbi:MAG: hypothetical protein ACK40K_00130, partial [Raineya sp.]